MPDVRVEMNSAGAKALLQSEEVQALLREKAEAISAAAGGEPDYPVEVIVGAARARASVSTGTFKAIRDEATDRTLSSALDAGR